MDVGAWAVPWPGRLQFAPQYEPPVVETPVAFKEAAGAGSEIAKASGECGARRAAMVFVGSGRSAAARTVVERF